MSAGISLGVFPRKNPVSLAFIITEKSKFPQSRFRRYMHNEPTKRLYFEVRKFSFLKYAFRVIITSMMDYRMRIVELFEANSIDQ